MNAAMGWMVLAALAVPGTAADYSLDLKPEETRIKWTLGDVLHVVHGSFGLKSGHIQFNPDTGKAEGRVVVDTLSGNSGGEARDRRMHANVLESAKFPEAAFVPDRVQGAFTLGGSSTLKLHGLLNIHGSDHEIEMNVQVNGEGEILRTKIDFAVPYVAWGMKDPSTFVLRVSKTVLVDINANAVLTER